MFRSVFREIICIPKMAVPYSKDVRGLNSLTFLVKAIICVQILTNSSYLGKLFKNYNT